VGQPGTLSFEIAATAVSDNLCCLLHDVLPFIGLCAGPIKKPGKAAMQLFRVPFAISAPLDLGRFVFHQVFWLSDRLKTCSLP
jgi:hypothetical protein